MWQYISMYACHACSTCTYVWLVVMHANVTKALLHWHIGLEKWIVCMQFLADDNGIVKIVSTKSVPAIQALLFNYRLYLACNYIISLPVQFFLNEEYLLLVGFPQEVVPTLVMCSDHLPSLMMSVCTRGC